MKRTFLDGCQQSRINVFAFFKAQLVRDTIRYFDAFDFPSLPFFFFIFHIFVKAISLRYRKIIEWRRSGHAFSPPSTNPLNALTIVSQSSRTLDLIGESINCFQSTSGGSFQFSLKFSNGNQAFASES